MVGTVVTSISSSLRRWLDWLWPSRFALLLLNRHLILLQQRLFRVPEVVINECFEDDSNLDAELKQIGERLRMALCSVDVAVWSADCFGMMRTMSGSDDDGHSLLDSLKSDVIYRQDRVRIGRDSWLMAAQGMLASDHEVVVDRLRRADIPTASVTVIPLWLATMTKSSVSAGDVHTWRLSNRQWVIVGTNQQGQWLTLSLWGNDEADLQLQHCHIIEQLGDVASAHFHDDLNFDAKSEAARDSIANLRLLPMPRLLSFGAQWEALHRALALIATGVRLASIVLLLVAGLAVTGAGAFRLVSPANDSKVKEYSTLAQSRAQLQSELSRVNHDRGRASVSVEGIKQPASLFSALCQERVAGVLLEEATLQATTGDSIEMRIVGWSRTESAVFQFRSRSNAWLESDLLSLESMRKAYRFNGQAGDSLFRFTLRGAYDSP